ncbi:hypothetical protein AN958_06611 [Leucoagaricus sp. SymC.cos]|nr:hypothetical protein AN958_06611 [Leucoagaricus sp. SymC.cos]
MDDPPYTTPEEDPFNVRHVVQLCTRPRKSSLFKKWIQEQLHYTDLPAIDTHSHFHSHSQPLSGAFFAYPELSRSSLDRTGPTEPQAVPDTSSYDLVEDDDIPQRLAAEFASLKVTDTPATIRTSKRNPRMSLSPPSFRHFNFVFRSNTSNNSRSPTEESLSPSRPSSRLSLFTRSNRNSGGTVTSRATITPQSTPQKRSKRASQIVHQTPSPRKSPPAKIRPRTTSSKWRPTVLGHFSHQESAAPAASQTSIQPPPSDSNYTPSRPSLSSSADVSHTHTSLTVPSVESSSIRRYPASISSEQKHSPPNARSMIPARPSSSGDGRRRVAPNGPVPSQPQFKQHNRGFSSFISPAAASSASSLRSACPSSINTTNNIHDVFSTPDREPATPSPTHSSSPFGRGTSPYGMGQYPKMYPFVYNKGVQSKPSSVTSRRGGNAFDGIPSAWRYPSIPAPGAGFDYEIDDADDEFATGSTYSQTFSASQQHSPSCQYHPDQHQLQRHEKQKKKAHVVYTSASQGGGGTLSKMTSFSNLAMASLSPMTMTLSRNKKKKKRLIISGVAPNDTKKFEGIKRWCESFGEVRQILRMPNGDLVVSFQSAEVADTVCRVRAKVFINGVGSVQLSWTTEKKR